MAFGKMGAKGGFSSFGGTGTVAIDAATNAWVAAVVSDGGSVSNARKTLVNNLIVGLKTDGVFSKLDRLWLFAAANTQSALRDLVAASAATAVNSPAFSADNGYTGAATKSINSNFNPATAGGKFVRDSASLFAWSNTSGADNQMMGQAGLSTFIYPQHAGTTAYTAINEAFTTNFFAGVGNGLGWYHGNRNAAATEQFYKNGSVIQTATNASTALESSNFLFLTAGADWLGQCAGGGFGQSLTATEAGALYARIRTYMTAVGIP